ncbi:hypothetical protein QBC35DRAFT_507093 [Podospora australis]|uniref:Heterokaryon incompatibility domain-containing protein n=1 Tax=Podospora australis TaxID=1536484 RepID=A0AAN6WKU8_9PEZI|nr:hypothetical protein QBC35DRAFT_507093 [Podospora australis]
MRLLETSTLRLVSKREGEIPPYAILSHTWGGDDDEVTYQDILELSASRFRLNDGSKFAHRVTKKKGFAKIRDSAKLALSSGYNFIWIDTCCIDKTSSAELSEAINSMFRWYREATICYAYLVDVPAESEGQNISSSRWFTRGWTLQELLAPSDVWFYDQGWGIIGSKLGPNSKGLADKHPEIWRRNFVDPAFLNRVTGVDTAILTRPAALEDVSVASKMKWAANRQTTRTEDVAYCLMGIFNVNMPLLYGEGTRSFMRLQEEILESTNDQTLFAWTVPPSKESPCLSGLLASHPSYFKDFGDIQPLSVNVSRSSAPSTMTNAGLHVQLYLERTESLTEHNQAASSDQYLAILDCYPHTQPSGITANLALRLVALGGDQYARMEADQVAWVPTDQKRPGGNTYIYVQESPVFVLPEIVVAPHSTPDINYVFDAAPITGWNDLTQTMRPEPDYFPDKSLLGLFTFRIMEAPEYSRQLELNVAVGVHPTSANEPTSWDCWCHLQPGQHYYAHLNLMAGAKPYKDAVLTARHVADGLMATVQTVKHRNRTYISLRVTQIYELEDTRTGYSAPEKSLYSTPLKEIPMVASSVAQDTWRSCFGHRFGGPVAGFTEAVIRTYTPPNGTRLLPEESRGTRLLVEDTSTWQSFEWVLEQAKKSNLEIQQSWLEEQQTKYTIFEQYLLLSLARACMRNDVNAASDLLNSPLSGIIVHVRTSIKEVQVEPWHELLSGFQPIHWAAALGHVKIVAMLIDQGADIKSLTGSGLSTVHLAAVMGREKNLHLLLNHTDTSWYNGIRHRLDSPAHLAASYLRNADVKHVLERLMFGRTTFSFRFDGDSSDASGQPETLFITRGDDTRPGATDLWVEPLLNKLGETPLHRTAAMGNFLAAEAFIDLYLGVLESGPLVRRSSKIRNSKQATGVQSLGRRRAKVLSPQDSLGRTPLFHAAASGAVEIVQLLLANDVPIDVPDNLGRTPLHIACREGHLDVVRILVQKGANIRATTPEPVVVNAVHFAVCNGNADVLAFLVGYGVDPDLNSLAYSSLDMPTPLQIAAVNGFLDCVKLLCEAGCSRENKAAKGIVTAAAKCYLSGPYPVYPAGNLFILGRRITGSLTPAEFARERGHEEIWEYLSSLRKSKEEETKTSRC